MQIVDLFAGIGGFSLAGHALGWDTVQMVEINPFCQKVLGYHFPDANIHSDIKTFTVDTLKKSRWDAGSDTIVCGGFPCQPYSEAGKRKGKEDDRHLWPEMLRAICEIQPLWVVGENVPGIISWGGGLVFEEVQADLEAEGYEVQPVVLPACAVNAPHRRDRVWFVAYNSNSRVKSMQQEREYSIYEPQITTNSGSNGHQSRRPGKDRCEKEEGESFGNQRERVWNDSWRTCEQGIIANTESEGVYRLPIRKEKTHPKHGIVSGYGDATNPDSGRQSSEEYRKEESGMFTETSVSADWSNFPTQSPICYGNDGVPPRLDGITFPRWRNESIKAAGNAIVPQIAYEIFKAIEAYVNKLQRISP